jgi:hypothetical protein
MIYISPTQAQERLRAIKDAEYGDLVRATDWLRTWLPDTSRREDPCPAALAGARSAETLKFAAAEIADGYARDALDAGASFEEVGRALSISRQAAAKRYPEYVMRRTDD